MKNKKMLSLLLSAIMLVGSMPAYVLAQGNDGEEDDPEMADQDTDEPDEDGDGEDPDEEDFDDDPMGEDSGEPKCIGELEENKVFPVGQMEAYEVLLIQFTPTSTGRYGFLCADGCDLSCTFLDDYEPVYPIEEKCEYRYDIQYLNLEAGKTYDIEVASNDDATLDDKEVYCYICPMSETLPYGESTLFVQGSDNYTRHTFIPETSGRYILEFSGYYTINAQITQDQRPESGYQSSNGKIVAELEAGVPYDITVYSYLYLLADVVHVNISMDIPSLDTGENRVELGPYYETTFCTFEPKTSGVYVIYSEGNEDTVVEIKKSGVKISDDNRGEGDNFVIGSYLQKGEIYEFAMSQKGYEDITVPVVIELADKIQPEEEVTFSVGYKNAVYYEITPSQSGWYYLDSGNTSQTTSVFDANHNRTVLSLDTWYMTAGDTYTVMIEGDETNGDPGKFTIHQITQELQLQEPSTMVAHSSLSNAYYAIFTAEETGYYVFSSDHQTYNFYLCDKSLNHHSLYQYGRELNAPVFITAGSTYFVALNVPNGSDEEYVITVQKQDNIVQEGVYEVDFQNGETRTYNFTPSTSGYYLVGLSTESSNYPTSPVVFDGSLSSVGESSSGPYFSYFLARLEQGKKYGIQISHSEDSIEGMYWFVQKLDYLTPGEDIEVQVHGKFAICAFTPSESGVYTFTSEKFGKAYSKLLTYNRYMETIINSTDSQLVNSLSAVLEKGKTYVLFSELYSADCTSFHMDLIKEQALIVGDNTVSIADRNSIFDGETNAICSFTPKADGLYEFCSQSTKDVDPTIKVYDSKRALLGEDDSSGEEDNFKLELILEAGKTYYVDISESDEYELPVKVSKLELMENKLEGYSLSLNGSIAVNLYMTLSDLVFNSDTAVLQYTRADGTVVSYDMNAADREVLNGKTYYVFHLPVAAKEMASELKVQIVDPGSSFEGKEYTFTVKDYADRVLNIAASPEYYGIEDNREYVKAKPLVEALLNYGTAAQKYFGYNTDYPANDNVDANNRYLGNVPTSTLPQYNPENTKLPDGVTFAGASLSLESETTLTFYFSNPSGVKLSFYDGKGARISSGTSGEYITVRVKNIPAHKLSDYVTLSIKAEGDSGEYSITYNPMTYCYNVLTRPLSATRTQDLKDLMKAFYFYNQAAVRYEAAKGKN